LIIIPEANKCGLILKNRYLPYKIFNNDLNRNYPYKNNKAKDNISRKIIKLVNQSDLIVDFHEGWGFHCENPNSLGSTITTSNTSISNKLGKNIVNNLNKNINEYKKKFTLLKLNKNGGKKVIKGTLDYYCMENNLNYLLIETTGQKNIQPINKRMEQNSIIINTILKN
jgi:hypothetical protein